VAIVRRWNWLLAGLAVIIVLVIAYAWVDGGHEPVRELSEPVPLPELPA
jgi:divalent metal cation (Fe/Co/Zn/Cd) transporter